MISRSRGVSKTPTDRFTTRLPTTGSATPPATRSYSVVHTVRSQLRSYDSVVRLGGDEFLCVMSGATVSDARERFAAVDTSLAAPPDPCHIRVGFTELASEDLAADLIERADADMPTNHAR